MAKKPNPLDNLRMTTPPPTARAEPDRTPWNKKDDDDPTKVKRKTYLLTNELIDRLQALADENGLGVNELVRHLIGYAIDQIDSGNHKLPIVTRNTLE